MVQNFTELHLMPDIHLFWNPLYDNGKSLYQKVTLFFTYILRYFKMIKKVTNHTPTLVSSCFVLILLILWELMGFLTMGGGLLTSTHTNKLMFIKF